MFSISFNNIDVRKRKESRGTIEIGDFRETFLSPLIHWNRTHYRNHWNDAIERILTTSDRSALVTAMHIPKYANFIVWWPMYADGDNIHFHNSILPIAELGNTFNEERMFDFIDPRKRVTPSGEGISEWTATKSELETFLASLDEQA